MDTQALSNLYIDYLISSYQLTTFTGLSELLDGQISHDRFQRLLQQPRQLGAALWKAVKSFLRAEETEEGVLVLDDSIARKRSTDENDHICWHWDHSEQRNVKGINFLTILYHTSRVSLPIGVEIVEKTEKYIDKKTNKERKRSTRTKNAIYRDLIQHAVNNQIKFKYILNDSWYSSAENMCFVHKLKKKFIMPLKENRLVSRFNEEANCFEEMIQVKNLPLEPGHMVTVRVNDVPFPLHLVKQVFKNENGADGVLYLVTNDVEEPSNGVTEVYKKRWPIEPYHKSLKQNASLCRSPTQTKQSQVNHFFYSLCGYIKLEMIKIRDKLNHHALRRKLYMKALKASYEELAKYKPEILFV